MPTADIVGRAVRSGTAAVAFNVLHLETAEALAAAAEQTGVPLILGISENCIRYHGGLLPLVRATLAVAEGSAADLSVHLDHVTDPVLIRAGVAAGVSSVMIDASALPYDRNLALTADLAAWCHAGGIYVEAELGEVGGKDGVHAPGARTDPAEAAVFVRDTGVDALAVAVGSSHAMTERTIVLDKDLIAALHAALPVPLVLHGSSGVPDEEIRRAVTAGMTKINISTHLVSVFTATVRDVLAAQPDLVDSRRYLGPARAAVTGEAARLLRVLTASVPA
ncbi:MAG TPA: class II fructose-bisphosphate aldolase [Streptosporangiaceae bacterium]|nr:class II fructose-bisphosphate aldolase [Streptosporangiaceae bacterium]